MDIVIDANITVALFVNLSYSPQVEILFQSWLNSNNQIYTPALWPSEVVSSLRIMVTVGQISVDKAKQAINKLSNLPVHVLIPDAQLLESSLIWAEKLNQRVAYDAQYVAAAEYIGADLWTADKQLYLSGKKLNVTWIHWISEK